MNKFDENIQIKKKKLRLYNNRLLNKSYFQNYQIFKLINI